MRLVGIMPAAPHKATQSELLYRVSSLRGERTEALRPKPKKVRACKVPKAAKVKATMPPIWRCGRSGMLGRGWYYMIEEVGAIYGPFRTKKECVGELAKRGPDGAAWMDGCP